MAKGLSQHCTLDEGGGQGMRPCLLILNHPLSHWDPPSFQMILTHEKAMHPDLVLSPVCLLT